MKQTHTIKPILIVEIGASHQGSLETAKRMVSVAASYIGAQVCKFQKRYVDSMAPEVLNRPYDNPNSFGATYGEHRRALELGIEDHARLAMHCDKEGITYSTSVWDLKSADQIVRNINPRMIKIPSACNTNWELIQWLKDNYKGEIHISMGMTTLEDKEKILSVTGSNERFVHYLCTSAYPCGFGDVCLRDLEDGYYRGLSGHHLGIAVDIAALAMGCEYFERHFTLDRTQKGTDHAASLEPDGMRKLKRDLENVSLALQKSDGGIKECEKSTRIKLKGV